MVILRVVGHPQCHLVVGIALEGVDQADKESLRVRRVLQLLLLRGQVLAGQDEPLFCCVSGKSFSAVVNPDRPCRP